MVIAIDPGDLMKPYAKSIWYTLVILVGFGKIPMLLLTNKTVNIHDNKQLWQIVEIYLTRWKCYMGLSIKLKIMVQKIFLMSKRFFGVPTSIFNYSK